MEHKPESTIIAFSVGSYPYGNAASNRALSYLRGLTELDCKVSLILFSPDKDQSRLSNKRSLVFNNITIRYVSPLLYPRGVFLRRVNLFMGVLCGFSWLLNYMLRNKKKPNLLLLYTNPVVLYIFLIFPFFFRVKIFHERTEYPFIRKDKSIMLRFYLKKIIPKFNGIYVISNALVTYFKNFTQKPILLLPMTVEADRFNFKKSGDLRYIAYCGSMYSNKDGVHDLIEAFNIVADKYLDLYLYLIGDNKDIDKFRFVSNKISISPVRERIICTGHIDRDNMPALLKNATMLVLCRPNNIQAQGGFPTKLGEYLATGNPVVITDVGEHTIYLKHRLSAFIAQPDNPVDFAAKIQECLDDEPLASSVGNAGYKVAMGNFNYLKNAALLKNFVLQSL